MITHHHVFKLWQVLDRESNLSFVIHNHHAMSLNIYKNNNNIKGITMGCVESKITQLVYDTTLFLRDIGSIQTTIKA